MLNEALLERLDHIERERLLSFYHEHFIKPELVRLNRLAKTPRLKEIEDFGNIVEAQNGRDYEQMKIEIQTKEKEIDELRKSRPSLETKPVLGDDEICKFLQGFAEDHNRVADSVSQIHQLRPFYQSIVGSDRIHPTHLVHSMPELRGAPPVRRDGQPQKEQLHMNVCGWQKEIWQYTEWNDELYVQDETATRGYLCWPEEGKKPSIYLKFNSKGLYWLQSDPDHNPEFYDDCECHININFEMTYGQVKFSGGAFHHWHRTEKWPILSIGGKEIKTTGGINGAQLKYIDHPSGYDIWPDVPMYVNMNLRFSCSVRDWAWTIIDLRGWDDLPFWYLFDVWVIGAQPA